MDVTLIIKIAGVGLLVSVVYQVLVKSGREEQGMMVSLAGVIVVLLMLITELAELIDKIRQIFGI